MSATSQEGSTSTAVGKAARPGGLSACQTQGRQLQGGASLGLQDNIAQATTFYGLVLQGKLYYLIAHSNLGCIAF